MVVRKSISFSGTVPAHGVLTVVSSRVMSRYRVKRLHVRFAPGCQGLVLVRLFVSSDDSAPASGAPGGASLLVDYGQVDYVRGDGETLVLEHDVPVDWGGSYVKVFATNGDFYPHSVDVVAEIEVES